MPVSVGLGGVRGWVGHTVSLTPLPPLPPNPIPISQTPPQPRIFPTLLPPLRSFSSLPPTLPAIAGIPPTTHRPVGRNPGQCRAYQGHAQQPSAVVSDIAAGGLAVVCERGRLGNRLQCGVFCRSPGVHTGKSAAWFMLRLCVCVICCPCSGCHMRAYVFSQPLTVRFAMIFLLIFLPFSISNSLRFCRWQVFQEAKRQLSAQEGSSDPAWPTLGQPLRVVESGVDAEERHSLAGFFSQVSVQPPAYLACPPSRFHAFIHVCLHVRKRQPCPISMHTPWATGHNQDQRLDDLLCKLLTNHGVLMPKLV